MNKPNDTILWLAKSWPIKSISLCEEMIDDRESRTHITLMGSQGKGSFLWPEISPYIDVSVDYNSVARLLSGYKHQADQWFAFEKANAADLAELKRLQEKLGIT